MIRFLAMAKFFIKKKKKCWSLTARLWLQTHKRMAADTYLIFCILNFFKQFWGCRKSHIATRRCFWGDSKQSGGIHKRNLQITCEFYVPSQRGGSCGMEGVNGLSSQNESVPEVVLCRQYWLTNLIDFRNKLVKYMEISVWKICIFPHWGEICNHSVMETQKKKA